MQDVVRCILKEIPVASVAQLIGGRLQQGSHRRTVGSVAVVATALLERSVAAPTGQPVPGLVVAIGAQIETVLTGQGGEIRSMGYVAIGALAVFEGRMDLGGIVVSKIFDCCPCAT